MMQLCKSCSGKAVVLVWLETVEKLEKKEKKKETKRYHQWVGVDRAEMI